MSRTFKTHSLKKILFIYKKITNEKLLISNNSKENFLILNILEQPLVRRGFRGVLILRGYL